MELLRAVIAVVATLAAATGAQAEEIDYGPDNVQCDVVTNLCRTGENTVKVFLPNWVLEGPVMYQVTPIAIASAEAATTLLEEWPSQLSEFEMLQVLRVAGWPEELIPQALAVTWCESQWGPYKHNGSDPSGGSHGLFQLNGRTWFDYSGEDFEQRYNPLVNARAAWATYQYDLAKGYAPWKQWTCKP